MALSLPTRDEFGAGAESGADGIMITFDRVASGSMEAMFQLPRKVNLGPSLYLNFYCGFNEEGSGRSIVEAGISYSYNEKDYGREHTKVFRDGNSIIYPNPANRQEGHYWNYFINDGLTGASHNFPATSDIGGQSKTVRVSLEGGFMRLSVDGAVVPPIKMAAKVPALGSAKMVAAAFKAGVSFDQLTMQVRSLGGSPVKGTCSHVCGSERRNTFTGTGLVNGFMCSSRG